MTGPGAAEERLLADRRTALARLARLRADFGGIVDASRDSNAKLPGKVDAVMETVGRATWSHSIRSLRPGGAIVISGTTSGPKLDDAELTRIFFLQLSVIGSTMGTRAELASLVSLMDATGTRPLIDQVLPMEQGRDGFAAMAEGDVFGKVVFTR